MRIEHVECLSPECIVIGGAASDRYALIDQLISVLVESGCLRKYDALSLEVLAAAVREREEEQATGLEHGIAFPHARVPGLSGLVLALAILDEPVNFQGLDGIPADFVCLMLVPDDNPGIALTCMAQLSTVFSNPINRAYLRKEQNRSKIRDFLLTELGRAKDSVTAGQLMRHPMADIYPDTPIHEVTRVMAELHLDTISVVDREGTLLGVITCQRLAQLGLPEFFSKLKTVSFISEFDPLVKYFEKERTMLAEDAMQADYAALNEDATLLEVIFELAVRRHSKVFVVREGKRVGVIDWNWMLNRVINI